jgi:hypothetical protein
VDWEESLGAKEADVTRYMLPTIIAAVLTATSSASDPSGTRRVKKAVTNATAPTNPIAQVMAELAARERRLARDVAELLAGPQPRIVQFMLRRCHDDPNFRMQRLLNESEDLRQAREEFHRFWKNNQPSVLKCERLKGAIGP